MISKRNRKRYGFFKDEKELAIPILSFLKENGYEVWQEVQFFRSGPIHDIVAVRNNSLNIIECKLYFGLPVLEQAIRAQNYSNKAFIAVPVSESHYKYGHLLVSICKAMNIGIIFVYGRESFYDKKRITSVEVKNRPERKEFSAFDKQIKKLESIPKSFAEAGTNKGGYFTPYKATIENVKEIIRENPGITLSMIIKKLDGNHHYASDNSARGSLRKSFTDFEKDWCVVDDTNYPPKYYIKDNSK